jgi:hypothetical protein
MDIRRLYSFYLQRIDKRHQKSIEPYSKAHECYMFIGKTLALTCPPRKNEPLHNFDEQLKDSDGQFGVGWCQWCNKTDTKTDQIDSVSFVKTDAKVTLRILQNSSIVKWFFFAKNLD